MEKLKYKLNPIKHVYPFYNVRSGCYATSKYPVRSANIGGDSGYAVHKNMSFRPVLKAAK